MKILQVINRIPFPLNDGGNIGVHYYTEGFLKAGVELSMLAMNTSRHWVNTEQLPDLYRQLKHFVTVPIDNRVRILPALLNLFSSKSYNIERFVSKHFELALIDLLKKEDFDVIQLEGLYLTPYIHVIRQYSKAKISIRQHNIEFRIWERLAARAVNPLKKAYLRLLAARLKRFELEHMNDYDLVLPISKEDEQYYRDLGTEAEVFLHPFGIHTPDIPCCPAISQPLSLYHIGAMDWLPNQESVNWLVEKVMPLVNKALPETILYLAGRNMPSFYFENTWKNVVVLGEVPDALAFERDKSILLVPLLSGGGVRIKIFQGMAMGKAIVTTPVGIEGIEASDGTHVFIAEDPELFAARIIELVHNPRLVAEMGEAARNLIMEKYSRQHLIASLLARYQQLLVKS
jgi:glycosyltransferase involved in cell wall biosynthesis